MAALDHLQESGAVGGSGASSISVNIIEVGNTTTGNAIVANLLAANAAARTITDDVNGGGAPYGLTAHHDVSGADRDATQRFLSDITGGDTTVTADLTGNNSGYFPCLSAMEIEGEIELDDHASNPVAEQQSGNNVTFSAVTLNTASIIVSTVCGAVNTFDDTSDGWTLEQQLDSSKFNSAWMKQTSGSHDLDCTTPSHSTINAAILAAYRTPAAGGITSSGTPATALPTSSGAAKVTRKASGTPATPLLTSTGAAVKTVKASGTPAAPLLTSSGAAVKTVKASGTPAIALLTAEGVAALEANAASGAPTLPALTSTGAGAKTVKASGTPSSSFPTAAGAAKRSLPASGAPATALPTATGVGSKTVKATGVPAIALVTAEGSASLAGNFASGTPSLPLLTATGTGKLTIYAADGAPVIAIPIAAGQATGPQVAAPDKLADPSSRQKKRKEPFDRDYFIWKYGTPAEPSSAVDPVEADPEPVARHKARLREEARHIDEDIEELELELDRVRESAPSQAAQLGKLAADIEELEGVLAQAVRTRRRREMELAAIVAIIRLLY